MRATINGVRIAIVALFFYWVLLFFGTHIPPDSKLLAQVHQNDKIIHALAFTGLSFLMAWAIPTDKARLHKNVLYAAVASVAYAAIDELLQIPVGRTADFNDFAADCIGVCVGLAFYTVARAVMIKAAWKILTIPESESSKGS